MSQILVIKLHHFYHLQCLHMWAHVLDSCCHMGHCLFPRWVHDVVVVVFFFLIFVQIEKAILSLNALELGIPQEYSRNYQRRDQYSILLDRGQTHWRWSN